MYNICTNSKLYNTYNHIRSWYTYCQNIQTCTVMKPVICTVVVQAIKPLKSEISVLYSVHAETFKFV